MPAKISIIMPVYNAEKTIEETLRSLENQTYSDIEIICVNDGSIDKSLEILQNHALTDSRVIVLNQENSGPAVARNTALNVANGEYIMFCDSDDKYEPQMCQRMFETIEEKKVDLVMCDAFIHVDKNAARAKLKKHVACHKLNITGHMDLNESIIPKLSVVLWNKIYRKTIIDNNNIRFPNGYTSDDDAFNLLYFTFAQSAYGLDEELYNYYIRENSIMANTLKKNSKYVTDIFYSLYYVFEQLNSKNVLEKNIMWLLFVINKCLYSKLGIVEDKMYEEIFRLVRDILKFVDYETVVKSGYKLLTYIRADDYQKYFSFIKNQGAESFLQKFFSLKNFGNKKVLKIFGLGFSFDRD